MRKGLTVTLMTVAVAMMGLQAMAMAPVISDIPSPIVGDGVGATTPNVFVYPDAFNLANYVTDDYTSSTSILWSYWISGTPKYRINNIAPLDPGTEDPVTPGAKAINTQVGSGELNPDGNAATLTIRNINLSPIANPTAAEPGVTGKLTAETQLVTLFASDGTTYSSKSIAFYTYNNFDDQLTPGNTPVPVVTKNFVGSSQGWTGVDLNYRGTIGGIYYGGTLSMSTGATGICFNVSTDGNNSGQYTSPWGLIPLIKNAVYHVRMKMNGSQTTVGHSPFWDVVISNYLDATHGRNAYGVDSWFMDNRGGANAVLQTAGGTSFHLWFAPAPITTAAWNADNGIFDPAIGNQKDGYIYWRVMDDASVPAITADQDSGSLCMTDLSIERFDIGAMQFVSTDYNPTLSQGIKSQWTTSGEVLGTDAGGTMGTHQYYTQTTVTFSGGTVTLQPDTNTTAVSNNDLVAMYPKEAGVGHYDNDPLVPACYPVVWKSDTLYQITYDLSAPDANSETNPVGVYFIGADVPTNELICDSWTCSAKNRCGMPKYNLVQTYMSFFWSHKVSNDTVNANNKRIRPRFQMGNNANLRFANDSTPGSLIPPQGGIKIHAVKVNEVRFTGAMQ